MMEGGLEPSEIQRRVTLAQLNLHAITELSADAAKRKKALTAPNGLRAWVRVEWNDGIPGSGNAGTMSVHIPDAIVCGLIERELSDMNEKLARRLALLPPAEAE